MGNVFEKITHNLLLTAFATAAALGGRAQGSEPQPASTKGIENAMAASDTAGIAAIESLSKKQLATADSTLIQDARNNYMNLLPYMQNNYSQQLKKIQDSTNAYLARQGYGDKQVIVFDPLRFDVIEALSLSEKKMSGEMVTRETQEEPPSTITSSTSSIGTSFRLPTGSFIAVDAAHAYLHEEPSGRVLATIVPISAHALPYNIAGLSLAENVTFANKHEAWHCIDFILGLAERIFSKLPGAQDKGEHRDIFRKGAVKDAIIAHNREALADVAALGDMIREGKNTSIIDPVAEWRVSFSADSPDDARDIGHLSTLPLRELKDRINKMGLHEFRALSEDETRDFYMDIIRDKGLSPAMLRKGTKYEKSNPASAKTPDTGIEIFDRNAGKILRGLKSVRQGMFKAEKLINGETRDMFDFYKLIASRAAKNYIPLNEAQKDGIAETMDRWDAQEILYGRAMKDHGKITPVTLIQAYCVLQDEILRGLAENTSLVTHVIAATKLDKLRDAFINQMDTEDYLLLNAERGVNLLKTEKCLEHLTPVSKLPDVVVKVPQKRP